MDNRKTFQTIDILAVYTGRATGGEFQAMHEVIEWVLGQPVWTHQLGSPEPWTDARLGLARQIGSLADVGDPPEGSDGFIEWVTLAMESLAASYDIVRGVGKSEEDATVGAIDSLMELAETQGKPVMVIGQLD